MKTLRVVLGRFRRVAGLLLILAAGTAAQADDIDIYTKQPSGALLPSTILVLDLNALGICDNVLTNPSAQPQCSVLQTTTSLATLLGIPGQTTINGLSTSTICDLYGALVSAGLATASQIPAVVVLGVVVTPAITITSAVCKTLSSLGLSSLLTTITGTVGGVLNPLLSTTLTNLSSSITQVLNAALPAVTKVLADPLSLTNLNTALTGLITPLVNSNVGIVVSHANRGDTSGNPTSYTIGGRSYACQFNDISTSSTLSSTARAATTNCSNGGYFLLGFFNVTNPVSTVNKILALLLGGTLNSATGTVTGGLLNLAGTAGSGGTVSASGLTSLLTNLTTLTLPLTPPFQEVENYVEIVHFLKDDVVYNAPLNTFDGPIFGPVGRDLTIETAPNSPTTDRYTGGAATVSSCRNVNVVNLQVTNDRLEYDSDADVRLNFPSVSSITGNSDATLNGTVSFPSLVQAAQNTGFTGKDGKSVFLNSFFILQDNLLPNIAALQGAGLNVLNYSTALGLFGTGQTVTQAQTLVTNASLATASSTSDRSSSTGLRAPTFFPLFKPLSARRPAWVGNLKRLDQSAMAASDGTFPYLDKNGASAIDTDGRIKTTALTIWTSGTSPDGRESTLGGAGQNIPGYVAPTTGNPTGGGGNPGIKNASSLRQLFYDSIPASGAPVLKALDADTSASTWTAEQTELAPFLNNCPTTSGDTTCQQLLLYARGYNVGTTSSPASNLATVTSRPWLMGAVLHSRPVAVNYGARSGYSATDPDIRVLVGSTDGFLRSIKNGNAASPSGAESWAFMPRAAMPDLKTLRDNAFVPQFPYGVDGAPAVLVIDRGPTSSTYPNGAPADGKIDSSNPNDHAYAYFGLRRGGSSYPGSGGFYYALDITNPDLPKLMWRIGRDGVYSANAATPGLVSGTSSQFTDLAQTFSTPVIGQMKFTNSAGVLATRPVVIFGGGYNGGVNANGSLIGKDLNNTRNTVVTSQVGQDDTIGNALYIVDAVTGELVWKAAKSSSATTSAPASTTSTPIFTHPLLQDGIASDVTALDTDGDGLTDRLYVGDTGGRVWRADFPGSDRSKWTIGPIASLGRTHGSTPDTTAANDRRFFHAPDYVPTRDASGAYDVILIGSGDREDPFNSTTSNWLYAIRDYATVSNKSVGGSGSNGVIVSASDSRLLTQTSLTDLTTSCSASGSPCAAANNLTSGWRLQLTGTGEKTTSAPLTVGSTVFVSTYLPSLTPACLPAEGSGKLYGIALRDSRPYVQSFVDAGSGRATTVQSPGFSGEPAPQTYNTIAFDAQTMSIQLSPNFPVFWRERLGDDEPPH